MSHSEDDDRARRLEKLKQDLRRMRSSSGVPAGSPFEGMSPREVGDAIFGPVFEFLNTESLQNESLPAEMKSAIAGGEDCDEISGASGEFGRSASNPIPVNGPVGELIYLSLLRTADGTPVMFHRKGSCDSSVSVAVDRYEVLSLDFAVREILYLSMYHPRKSRKAPAGYVISMRNDPNWKSDLEPSNPIYGVNNIVFGFPEGLDMRIRAWSISSLGVPLPVRRIREAVAPRRLS